MSRSAVIESVGDNTHATVIGRLGVRRLAGRLDLAVSTVSSWRIRNSIPARFLKPVADVCAEDGFQVTIDDLARMASGEGERTE